MDKTQVTLVTGDVVTLSTYPDGRQTAAVTRAHPDGPAGQFRMFNQGGDMYAVPQSAMPYLGTTLSLALFDVTRLANHPSQSTDVRVTYRSPSARQAVPGLHVGDRSGRTARGDMSQPRRFGAALGRQSLRDHAAPTHTTGLFAAVAKIAPPQPVKQPGPQPRFAMRTLTIHVLDAQGKKTNASVSIYNVDDLRKYGRSTSARDGLAKVSVPRGHYAALAMLYDYASGTVREVMIPQFTVRKDRAITLDARKATSPVSVSTPKPADAALKSVAVGRTDKRGSTGSYSFLGSSTTSFLVQPTTKRVRVGQLHFYTYWRMFSPTSASSAYTYDLKLPTDGAVPADNTYVIHAGDLASVDSKYPAMQKSQTALDTRFGALPWELFLFGSNVPLQTPTQRTEYYNALPSLSWESVYFAYYEPDTFTLQGSYDSSWRSYRPGSAHATTWVGQPTHPRLLQQPIYVGLTLCPACIDGSTLRLFVPPFADNSPQHRGYPDGSAPGLEESISYGVYADDVPQAQGTGFLSAAVPMPTDARRYRIDYDVARSSPYFTLSTDVHTRWSVRANAPQGSLPAGWVCELDTMSTDCGILPLMTVGYDLPVDMLGQIPSGQVDGSVHIGHLRGATSVAVRSVRVKVSYDSGDHWRRVDVTDEGSGSFGLSFTVPSASQTDGYAELRVSARDAYGGRFRQTIEHAFAVTGQ